MGTLKNFIIGVLIISIITFAALFGRLPAFRKGPIGLLHRLIWNTIPGILLNVDNRLLNGCLTSALRRLGHYLMHENHPLVLIFFLVLLLGSQLLFVPSAYSRLSVFHRMITAALCTTPYLFIYKAVTSAASYITPENHWQRMHDYPYDYVLFQPGRFCRTCHFRKPARSKHCGICKNYLTYLLTVQALQDHLVRGPERINKSPRWSSGLSWSRYFELWAWALAQDICVGGVGMLATLTAPLAWGFFIYHVYLIWAGMTTNESSKWADYRDYIADGLVFRCERDAKGASNSHLEFENVDWPVSSTQQLVVCEDGQPPSADETWRKLRDLSEADNLYDLGFWDNLIDILHT